MPRLIGVVFVFVGELFARENLVLLRQESFQRRTLRKPNGPLASVGEREQGALVVNAANHHLRFWQRGNRPSLRTSSGTRSSDARSDCRTNPICHQIDAPNPFVTKKDIDSLHHFVKSLHDDGSQPIELQIVDSR